MLEIDQKTTLIQRIVTHLDPVPANAVQELLGQSVGELTAILEKLANTREQEQAEEATLAHARESRRASQFDAAWVGALRNVSLNGKRLCDVESNRAMLESLLQAHEVPSGSLYGTIALSYPTKFSWEIPQVKPTKEDQRKAFDAFVREHTLSSTDANFNLYKEGASVDNFAGASGLERAQYASEAAQARQHFLIHTTPSQLKVEAAYESQQNREAAQREEADRAHKFVVAQQQGLYAPLPAVNGNGETIDAKYLRRISTIDYPLFKRLVQKHGSGQLTSRLRGEN
jgi:hypothetical protein